MATIPPKTWSWRGHFSGQNILFFQFIKIKLVVNEGTLSMHVKYMLSFLSTKSFCYTISFSIDKSGPRMGNFPKFENLKFLLFWHFTN